MSPKSKLDYVEQMNFIEKLIKELKNDLKEGMSIYSSNDIYRGIPNYTRMQNDIVRIRKELNTMSKMLSPYN